MGAQDLVMFSYFLLGICTALCFILGIVCVQ